MLEVSSDKKRKPRYLVTEVNAILFGSDSGSQAIQWAIDHTEVVEVSSPIELDSHSSIIGNSSATVIKKTEKRKIKC